MEESFGAAFDTAFDTALDAAFDAAFDTAFGFDPFICGGFDHKVTVGVDEVLGN